MKKQIMKGYLSIVISLFIVSCSNNDVLVNNVEEISYGNYSDLSVNKEQCLQDFSRILSKAIYNEKELRKFLKKEALKQFDKNYDVLYYFVKEEKITNDKSLRDILISYSSEEQISVIERQVPLLNILIPRISLFDIKPEELNVEDAELPVAVNSDSVTNLLINGKNILKIPAGEVPNFHVVVVNENRRMKVEPVGTRGISGNMYSYSFKDENYNNKCDIKTRVVGDDIERYKKAIEAFNIGFNKDDGSNYQKALQRDYIYYGMTPEKNTGNLNRSVTEYFCFLEVDPKSYFKISDQRANVDNDDPRIKNKEVTVKKRSYDHNRLIQEMWTEGAYNFIFEIITSKSDKPIKVYVPVYPDDIWDFHIKDEYKGSSLFSSSRHTYTIDPRNFTSKRYYLSPGLVTLAKWDISDEGLSRYVNVYEEDDKGLTTEKTETVSYKFSRVKNDKFNGDIKLSLGTGAKTENSTGNSGNIGAGYSSEITTTNTYDEERKIVVRKTESHESLGSIKIYFYDPIVEKKIYNADKTSTDNPNNGGRFGGRRPNASTRSLRAGDEVIFNGSFGGSRSIRDTINNYGYHIYDTGSVRFGIDVR